MPLDGERLVIEPTFPKAAELAAIGTVKSDVDDDNDGWRLRNQWYSRRRGCDILIMERDGKIDWGLRPGVHHANQLLHTLGCSDAWGIEQEGRAVDLLGTLLGHRAFKQYLMTGMFIESSRRSQIFYLFRRLRPTLALSGRDSAMRILAGLCMHPIAYYSESWAGAMCPTDDVIAHLMLMRADEHMFWKRCNQHPPYRPEAGI